MAATTLSGFLQCNFLSMDPPMQAHFEALCKTCLPKKRKRELGSIVDTIPSAGKELDWRWLLDNMWCDTQHTVVIIIKSPLCFHRPGAASRWRSRAERVHPLQPIWCAHLDAPAVDGPECSPERHATYRSMCNHLLFTLCCCSRFVLQPLFKFPSLLITKPCAL